ncbi:MAG: hypothetical protein K8R54_06505, partial [Bacteroidales bacterium]|nr:hypothetical protein [Bacteroidales bacterium]
ASGGFAVGRYGTAKEMGDVFFSINEEEGTFVNAYTNSKGRSGGFAVGRYGTAKEIDSLLFSVNTNEGTFVNTFTDSKGRSGGFAVGRYGTAKEIDSLLFSVNTNEGTFVNTFTDSKGRSGGFAVGRYGTAKEIESLLFSVKKDEGTYAYVTGASGGFAVGRYGTAKGMDTTYFKVTPKRTDINYDPLSVIDDIGLFVNEIGTGGVGNIMQLRKNHFIVGYDDRFALDDFYFGLGNYQNKILPSTPPLFYSSNGDIGIRSTLRLNSDAMDIGASYRFPVINGNNYETLVANETTGQLSWAANKKDISPKESNENTSDLKEELDILKKENAQLRKDIEEIKELLKK